MRRLVPLIEDLLRSAGVKYDVVHGRAKSVESFSEKILRAGKEYADPLSDLTDLAGVRAVLYYVDDVKPVCDLIKSEFSVDWDASSDKSVALEANEFGYLSVHYVISLGVSRESLPEWREFAGLKAELQIRTVLQHAWASISHALQYKREGDVPQESRRRLYRLSSLMELADQEFCTLRKERRVLSHRAARDIERGVADIELNSVTLAEFVTQSDVVGDIVQIASEVGYDVVARENDGYVSDAVTQLLDAGIRTTHGLSASLESARKLCREYLKKQFDASGPRWRASPSFLLVLLLLPQFGELLTVDYLESQGWGGGVAERVINVVNAAEGARPN